MKKSLVILLLFILSGGVFMTSGHFMNIENDAKFTVKWIFVTKIYILTSGYCDR